MAVHTKANTPIGYTTLLTLSALLWAGCGADNDADKHCVAGLPYATEVVSFTAGEHAGFGDDAMPSIVLGAPEMGPPAKGSLDVFSLGVGGEIRAHVR